MNFTEAMEHVAVGVELVGVLVLVAGLVWSGVRAVLALVHEVAGRTVFKDLRESIGGTLLLGGLKNIAMLDEKSETPFLSKIPIVSFFFSRRTSQQGFSNLLIVIRARITDLSEEQSNWGSARTR